MRPRPDLIEPDLPRGLEVFQLTTEALPSCHVYPLASVFTPDSRRVLLHRAAHAHGSDPRDPEHRYLMCDVKTGEMVPLTDERGTIAPCVSLDGSYLYYFVNETVPGDGRLTLKRVRSDGTARETLFVMDGPLPGTRDRPSRPYPISSISSDGQRLALSVFLGDGRTEHADWGILIFDLERGTVEVPLRGPQYCRMCVYYCPSPDPAHAHDLLFDECHGSISDPAGVVLQVTSGAGVDHHLLRDDGTDLRDLPFGRDGVETAGRFVWWGLTDRVISGVVTRPTVDGRPTKVRRIAAGTAGAHAEHAGRQTPGAWRRELMDERPYPDFQHLSVDNAGRQLIADTDANDQGGLIYLADLPENESGTLENVRVLLRPRTSWRKTTHTHPCLSPDGRAAFFNSDESGVFQAYMVRGW